jgi:hypothetical protein
MPRVAGSRLPTRSGSLRYRLVKVLYAEANTVFSGRLNEFSNLEKDLKR